MHSVAKFAAVLFLALCSAAQASEEPRLVVPGPAGPFPLPDWSRPLEPTQAPLGKYWDGWEVVEEQPNMFIVRVPEGRPPEFYAPKKLFAIGYSWVRYHYGWRRKFFVEQRTKGYVAGEVSKIFRGNTPYPAITSTGSIDPRKARWFKEQYGQSERPQALTNSKPPTRYTGRQRGFRRRR